MLKIDPDVEVVYNFYNCVILKLVLLFWDMSCILQKQAGHYNKI